MSDDVLAVNDPDGPFAETIEQLAAMRARLVADGWTREQAQDIIAGLWRQVARDGST